MTQHLEVRTIICSGWIFTQTVSHLFNQPKLRPVKDVMGSHLTTPVELGRCLDVALLQGQTQADAYCFYAKCNFPFLEI
jgi:hypothetical protein